MLMFLKSYWVYIALAACSVMLIMSGNKNTYLEKQNELLSSNLNSCVIERDDLQSKVDVYLKAVVEQAKQAKEAEKERIQIVKKLSEQVNTLRNQKPPKDCQSAIDWAISNKGDITWKK